MEHSSGGQDFPAYLCSDRLMIAEAVEHNSYLPGHRIAFLGRSPT